MPCLLIVIRCNFRHAIFLTPWNGPILYRDVVLPISFMLKQVMGHNLRDGVHTEREWSGVTNVGLYTSIHDLASFDQAIDHRCWFEPAIPAKTARNKS